MKFLGLSAALVAVPSMGLVVPAAQNGAIRLTALSMSETRFSDESFEYVEPREILPTQTGKKMSEAIPFLECPQVLRDSDLAGNFGFDPLGFATSKEQLWRYRQAEIKHARLAMLAAVGWPLSELLDRSIADFFDAQALLDDGDRVPSVLNGGMGKVSPEFWGFCLGLSAAIDMYGLAKARRGGPDYFPGNLGFDPLGFFPSDKLAQERMKLAEIKHGRTAMIGVLGYVLEEYKTKMAVVDETPIFFQPITETVEDAVVEAIALEEALEAAIGTV